MPPQLKKKIGPLPLWGWLGAVTIGIAIYYVRQRNAAAAPVGNTAGVDTLGSTGTGAFGPIDPNSGIPYAFEAPQSSSTGTPSLSDLLGFWQQLQDAGLGPQAPAAPAAKNLSKKQRQKLQDKNKKLRQANKKLKQHSQRRPRGHHPATSTGAGASAGGHPHTASPHPKHRAKKK